VILYTKNYLIRFIFRGVIQNVKWGRAFFRHSIEIMKSALGSWLELVFK